LIVTQIEQVFEDEKGIETVVVRLLEFIEIHLSINPHIYRLFLGIWAGQPLSLSCPNSID